MTAATHPIGGYFGLELREGREFHQDALRLNLARNALALLIEKYNVKRIFLPLYTCSVVWEAAKTAGCAYELYGLNRDLYPDFEFKAMKPGDWFLFTNYFGLCDAHLDRIREQCDRVIVDNSQAFFAKPLPGVPTFYSARKFFGVPDGAYLYVGSQTMEETHLTASRAISRAGHLLMRAEGSVEEGYSEFKRSEELLSTEPVSGMSALAQAILRGIDYNTVSMVRRRNFNTLHEAMGKNNQLRLASNGLSNQTPLVYPLLTDGTGLRERLIISKVYIPCYWDNVRLVAGEGSWERKLTDCLTALPIDQRYGDDEMRLIIDLVQRERHQSNVVQA